MTTPCLRLLLILLVACLVALPADGRAQQQGALAALQAQDLRLASVAERILAANAAMCTSTMPLTGVVLHSEDQYGAAARGDNFANGKIAIARIVPGSAADRAGLRAGDGIVAINGMASSRLVAAEGAPLRDAAFEALAALPAEETIILTVERAGARMNAALAPKIGCRALVEIITSEGLMGRSDGRVIQLSFELASALDDDGMAVIFAHELAHVVLQHRARLEAAGVSKGLLGEFGRNQQLNRQVEVEADRLSPHLLANAGYDPQIAVAFWRSTQGQRSGGLLMQSFIYPTRTARSDLIVREVAAYLPRGGGPSWPGHLLALRDRPF